MMLQWSLSEWFCWNVMLHLSQGISPSRTHSDKAVSPKASEVSGWLIKRGERLPALMFLLWKETLNATLFTGKLLKMVLSKQTKLEKPALLQAAFMFL